MTTRARYMLLIGFICCVASQFSNADSDGFYCTSRGYIAFDLRNFRLAALRYRHVIKIVTFDSHGIRQAAEVPIEDFEVHTLTCSQDQVEVSGFNKGHVRYKLALSADRGSLRVLEHETTENIRFDPSQEHARVPQLGLSPPAIIPLESTDQSHFVLLFSAAITPVKGGLRTVRTAEIVEDFQRNSVAKRFEIYRSENTEIGD